jgi:hypothetical protein
VNEEQIEQVLGVAGPGAFLGGAGQYSECGHGWCARHGCRGLEKHSPVPECGHGCHSVCGCPDVKRFEDPTRGLLGPAEELLELGLWTGRCNSPRSSDCEYGYADRRSGNPYMCTNRAHRTGQQDRFRDK